MKYKKCCLGKRKFSGINGDAAAASGDLRQLLEDQQFGSLAEAQAFLGRHTLQENQTPIDHFNGLSPEQMYRILNYPFSTPELFRFPEVLNTTPSAPILDIFALLSEAIGEPGLKRTAKGNLPQKFCREASVAYQHEKTGREHAVLNRVNREEDFFDLHTTRLVAELSGLVRKYKGKFILSRKCRTLLGGEGLAAVYPKLFQAYVQKFNWGYRDRYPEIRLIQTAFLYSLYLLKRFGATWRPHTFYADCFLRAFPMVLDEVPPCSYFTPEEEARSCYAFRTLVNFQEFFGLARIKRDSAVPYSPDYHVKALPLLNEVVQFNLP